MTEVGELRPSQMIFTFGVGALVDLPELSVIIMGLNDWDERLCAPIAEERLLAAVRRTLGKGVRELKLPPLNWDTENFTQGPPMGAPVCAFPRWLRCSQVGCNLLATIDSGLFQLVVDRYRPERTRYVHGGCTHGTSPKAVPVRFLRACRNGHLSDFPWIEYVHENRLPCQSSSLTLNEGGIAGSPDQIFVKCNSCKATRSLADAFTKPDEGGFFRPCLGFHPHLREQDSEPCREAAKTMLLGASNSWFPIILSLLSLPQADDKLARLVEENWSVLTEVDSVEVARFAVKPTRMPAFSEYTPEQVWEAIERFRNQSNAAASDDEAQDLKTPEWEAFANPAGAKENRDFKLRAVAPPVGYERFFVRTVLAERLREVRALVGFNRLESRGDFTDADVVADERSSPLSRGKTPDWVPASQVRGEGIFLQFQEEGLLKWLGSKLGLRREHEFYQGHKRWRKFRNITPEGDAFPGLRFILLHSFSHALMRQLALECGYSAASIRERIYSRAPLGDQPAQAGVLLYTAAADSEGTLGGLVHLGQPQELGRLIANAFAGLRICASDPLCGEHHPAMDTRTVHGACCHACLFASETSCERGNRYLDRTVLIPTVADGALAYFAPEDETAA